MMKGKTLITGATGFTGSYIARWLVQQGESVRAIHRPDSQFALVEEVKDKIEWVEADLLDVPALTAAMQGVDKVYHAAATVSFDKRDIPQMMAINAKGTANVVNLCLSEGVGRLLHLSSVAAIGRNRPKAVITETDQWERSKYNSPYAISKFRAEREVWRGIVEGMNAVILNPSIILGGGWWNSGSARIVQRVAKGEKFYPPGKTGFVDVRDVVQIAHLLMESTIQQERFIVVAENRPYHEVMQQLAEELNVQPPSIPARPWMIQVLRQVEAFRSALTGSRPLITKAIARNMFTEYEFRHDKLRQHLDFTFRPLSQTLSESAKLYQKTHQQQYGILPFP